MYLDVRKNRYDGALGRIGLKFDPLHCLFSQTTIDTGATNFSSVDVYSSYSDYHRGGSGAGNGKRGKRG
jgi:hypothetical protein